MGKDIIHLFVNNKLVRVADAEQLKKESPEWTGEIGIGDIVHANDEKMRVMKLVNKYPDTEEDDHILEMYLE